MSLVQGVVGDAKYQQIIARIQQSFPDKASVVHEQHADALVIHIWQNADDATCQRVLGQAKPPAATIAAVIAQAMPKAGAPGGLRYYMGNATHTRLTNVPHSFTGHLPLVRVPLASTTAGAATVSTGIGDSIPQDHLFASASQIGFKYGDVLNFTPARVDIITPARLGGTRFGAIAVYVGYRNANDPSPSFYILEAGLATGESRVAFFSPDMGLIQPTKKGYAPTPFTDEQGFYSGQLTMNGDEPAWLSVNAMNSAQQTEVEVRVQYVAGAAAPIWPALLTAEAAARVGLIAVKRGQLVFEDILAPIGELLPWESRP